MIAPTTHAVAAILQRREDVRQRRRHAQLPEDGPAARRVGAHQLERARVGGLQAAQRVDRDGEERQVRGDHRHRAPALQAVRQLRVDPDDDHRRDREDRDRLARDDVRQEAALQRGASGRARRRARSRSTAPSTKPAAASFAVKSALWKSTVISGGWLTCAGCAERLEDRPDVRHRGVVDEERPRPAGQTSRPSGRAPRSHEQRRDAARPPRASGRRRA